MIVDHIKNRSRYEHCHKNIAAALQFIAEHADDPELKDGSYPVIPDEVIVHVLTKETHGRMKLRWKSIRTLWISIIS